MNRGRRVAGAFVCDVFEVALSTLRFLRTFAAVARHGSFAVAAEQMALTQSAVSMQMRCPCTMVTEETKLPPS